MSLASIDHGLADTGINTRQERILAIVRAKGFATIEALTQEFGVSSQTIRRDIIRLDEVGLLQRFHGGVGLVKDETVRLGYQPKREMNIAAKELIGVLAASLIEDRASVYLDVGTTVEAVARALTGRALRAVYTNSMTCAAILGASREFETYVSGGIVRGADGSLVGNSAVDFFEAIAVDVAVIGCSGFATDLTPMDFDPQKVAVKQAVLHNARHVLLVADTSKLSRPAVMSVAPLTAFSGIVMDAAPAPALERQIAKAGVACHYPRR